MKAIVLHQHGELVDGGFADLAKVAAEQQIRLPDGVSFEQAAALPAACGTAHRMLFTNGGIQQGNTVLILGAAGGVDVLVNFILGDTRVPSLKALKTRGKLLTCGASAGFAPVEDLRYLFTNELRMIGSNAMQQSAQLLTQRALVAQLFIRALVHRLVIGHA